MALRPLALTPLDLGVIRPSGWLEQQLHIQADGLSGHLDEFWPSIRDASWLGGAHDSWERAPYWLDGLVPLAFLLDRQDLLEKVHRHVGHILQHQFPSGWLGPTDRDAQSDPWPQFLALKVLAQYAQATADPNVVDAMLRCAHAIDVHLDHAPLSSWAMFRWQDLAWPLQWLYDRTGEAFLLELIRRAALQGYNWSLHLAHLPYQTKVAQRLPGDRASTWRLDNHVVNHAMAIKAFGLLHRMAMMDDAPQACLHAIAELDRCHGQATGIFTGDESLAGLMPSQGTELCAVVEHMFSLEILLTALGLPTFADRLERIAFNALPAPFSPDMWAHQYDQQANQVICRITDNPLYTNNSGDANIFGLEPQFGCCTANMHQGWPKLTTHLWMKTPDEGLAAVVWAPCRLHTQVRGVPVAVEVITDYPFRKTISLRLTPDRPVAFPLHLRIPTWTDHASLTCQGQPIANLQPGDFHVLDRTWSGSTEIQLHLSMPVRIERRYNDAATLHRGPLVYALHIHGQWERIHQDDPLKASPHADYQVHPTAPWNYALQIDPENPQAGVTFEERPVGPRPFSPNGAPVLATVLGRRLPGWGLEHDAAAPPPPSPVQSDQPLEHLTFLPYGCTHLRLTELPVLDSAQP